MERPKIQMMVNDGEEEELVELAAPSADAAIRLKSGDIKYTVKDTITIFMAEFGNFGKLSRDRHIEVNDIFAYGV